MDEEVAVAVDYEEQVLVETVVPEPPSIDSLPQPIAVLRRKTGDVENNTECVFYILGTAHVSRKSCEDTAMLIDLIRPELVLVELCNERQAILHVEKKTEVIPLSTILTEIRTGRTSAFQGIYSWLLARVGSDLDVSPGEEFRVAVKEAQKIGACVVLGDRPLSITLSRLWSALSLWEKCRLLGTLLWTGMSLLDSDEMKTEIEKMKDSDILTEAIKEVGNDFPSLLGPLITERDQYMTYIMQELAGKATKVVAVVGAGHLEGIKKNWDEEIDIETICRIPPKKRRLRSGVLLLGVAATGLTIFGVSRWRQSR